jgi:exopolysaccharide biosynthesis polyprenyl glycosylphosphotransferase
MASVRHDRVELIRRRRPVLTRLVNRGRAGQGALRPSLRAPRWLIAAVVVGDTFAVAVALAASQVIWRTLQFPDVLLGPSGAALAWPVLLAARGSYTQTGLTARNQGKRLVGTAVLLVALFALVAAVLERTVPLSTVIVVAPLVVMISSAARRAAGWRLRQIRRRGIAVRRVLAVGAGEAISELVDQLARVTDHPMVVVGACTEGGTLTEDIPSAGMLGRAFDARRAAAGQTGDSAVDLVLTAAREFDADTVCVVGGSTFSGDRLKTLSWALHDNRVDLVTAPGLVDVASHRIEFDRAGVVTLLHVRAVPRTGLRRFGKAVFDRVVAALLLAVLAFPMIVLGGAIRLTSPGPALFRQARLGRDAQPFTMFKFRTMVVDAEARQDELLTANEHDGLMFKLQNDPRVTRLGRLLRRSSLDELPQLINVLRGEMSLVGPRPPLPGEVAQYTSAHYRRLLVRPGMTGLWQVSGRSTLNWDETVRLDLRYIDNWTLGTDIRMLWRTVSAVLKGTGAY